MEDTTRQHQDIYLSGHTVVSLEQGRYVSGRESLEVVGGGFLYLSPLGVYNIHVTKYLYPGAVLEGPKQQGIRSINTYSRS